MLVTRRRLFASSAAWLASASAAATAPRPFFRGHRLPIGLQLYSVAAELRADFEGTLKAVADIGYSTVETAGYVGRSAQALRAAFDAHGLACTSAHVPVRENGAEPSLSGDLGKLAADLHALGTRHAVMSLFQFPERLSQPARAGESGLDRLARLSAELTLEDWRANAQFLNRVGAGLQ